MLSLIGWLVGLVLVLAAVVCGCICCMRLLCFHTVAIVQCTVLLSTLSIYQIHMMFAHCTSVVRILYVLDALQSLYMSRQSPCTVCTIRRIIGTDNKLINYTVMVDARSQVLCGGIWLCFARHRANCGWQWHACWRWCCHVREQVVMMMSTKWKERRRRWPERIAL